MASQMGAVGRAHNEIISLDTQEAIAGEVSRMLWIHLGNQEKRVVNVLTSLLFDWGKDRR